MVALPMRGRGKGLLRPMRFDVRKLLSTSLEFLEILRGTADGGPQNGNRFFTAQLLKAKKGRKRVNQSLGCT